MSARTPVVTGLGILGAPGDGVTEVWEALRSGRESLRELTLFRSPRYGQVLSGGMRRSLTGPERSPRGSRTDLLGWLAARDALRHAGLDRFDQTDRAGVVIGCTVGGSFDSERFLRTRLGTGRMRASPTRFHECMSVVDCVADSFECLGPSMAIATACSSGAMAIIAAAELIQAGEADVMLAGGADSLSWMTWAGFHSLFLVDPNGCRPFDVNRAGTSLGEGAGVLVLEAEEVAHRRGATILARLSGWGASCDTYHATAPDPEGAGAAAAMQQALERCGLRPDEIGYVNAHGTGTPSNDLAEARALRRTFGDHLPPISSTKRFFGHTLGASGAIEAVVCVEALTRQEIPPSAGFSDLDPEIGFEPVLATTGTQLRHVMSNSFGFGGNNAALLFSRPDMDARPATPVARPFAVAGLSSIGPGEPETRATDAPLPRYDVQVRSCGDLDRDSLSPRQRRSLSRFTQMALLTARQIAAPEEGSVPNRRRSTIIGTGLGCLGDAASFLENLISKEEKEPLPSRFPNSVHNAAAAQVAIALRAGGLNSAPTARETSFECALWQGVATLASGAADEVLVGAVDELNDYPLAIGSRWGLWGPQVVPGEGAVVARLVRDDAADVVPLAHVTAVRLGRYRRPYDASREARWAAERVDLADVDTIFTGKGGWSGLDEHYREFVAELQVRLGRSLATPEYRRSCGEFGAASAFGFLAAVEQIRYGSRGVLTYTLSTHGGKALCLVQP